MVNDDPRKTLLIALPAWDRTARVNRPYTSLRRVDLAMSRGPDESARTSLPGSAAYVLLLYIYSRFRHFSRENDSRGSVGK